MGGKVTAKAKAPKREETSSLHGSLHLWMHLTRNTSFASSSTCAVGACARIASFCISVALTRTPSLAWVITLHTNMLINEDARNLQGRRRPGRRSCLPFLQICCRRCMSRIQLHCKNSLFLLLLPFMLLKLPHVCRFMQMPKSFWVPILRLCNRMRKFWKC